MSIQVNNGSQEFAIMITLQENLNLRIGRERWKKYISSMFWHYVNTPINFTITLFTAITSGQVGSGASFLSNGAMFAMLFTTFVLSTINTFFKLKEVTDANYAIAQKFEEFAATFEQIYFTPINSDTDILERMAKYKTLQLVMNNYIKDMSMENSNYVTELCYTCAKYCCFKKRIKTLNISERMWVLDGRGKDNHYNKDHLHVNMDHFIVQVQPTVSDPYISDEFQVVTDHLKTEQIQESQPPNPEPAVTLRISEKNYTSL